MCILLRESGQVIDACVIACENLHDHLARHTNVQIKAHLHDKVHAYTFLGITLYTVPHIVDSDKYKCLMYFLTQVKRLTSV